MVDLDKDDDKIRMLQEKTTLFMITAEEKFERRNILVLLARGILEQWWKAREISRGRGREERGRQKLKFFAGAGAGSQNLLRARAPKIKTSRGRVADG